MKLTHKIRASVVRVFLAALSALESSLAKLGLSNTVCASNTANSTWFPKPGYHEDAQFPVLVTSGIADGEVYRGLLYAWDLSHAGKLIVCAHNQKPVAVVEDVNVATTEQVTPLMLGQARSTRIGVAAGAIPIGRDVYTADNGQVQAQPMTAGVYYKIGVASSAATQANDPIEFVSCVPQKVVVIAAPTVGAAVVTTAATNTTPYGYATQAQADRIVAAVNELLVDVKAMQGGLDVSDADSLEGPALFTTAAANTPG